MLYLFYRFITWKTDASFFYNPLIWIFKFPIAIPLSDCHIIKQLRKMGKENCGEPPTKILDPPLQRILSDGSRVRNSDVTEHLKEYCADLNVVWNYSPLKTLTEHLHYIWNLKMMAPIFSRVSISKTGGSSSPSLRYWILKQIIAAYHCVLIHSI